MDPIRNISAYRLYRGAGSAAAIDYSSPIATVEPPAPPGGPVSAAILAVAGGWPPGVTWFIAIRPVDAGGVEFADPSAIIRAEFDEAGLLLPPHPGPVGDLAARPAAGHRLRITFRYRAQPRAHLPAPVSFEIFLAPADGTTPEQMLAAAPAGTVLAPTDPADHSYAWTSEPLAVGRWRVGVHAVAEFGVAGPARFAVASCRASRAAAVQLLAVEVR